MGALTSKPYAFVARPWELRHIETIDVGDSEGAQIKIQLRGKSILRILPSQNFISNFDWITDRTRFSYDANEFQRLDKLLIMNFQPNLNWQKLNWTNYIEFLYNLVLKNTVENHSLLKFTIFNNLHVSEQTLINYELTNAALGRSHLIFNSSNENYDYCHDFVNFYTFDVSNYNQIYATDFILTIGLNLREEFPILYSRIRQIFSENSVNDFYQFGANTNQIFLDDKFSKNLGNNLEVLYKFAEGRSTLVLKYLKAKNPLILFGGVILRHRDFSQIADLFFKNFNIKLSLGILKASGLEISANHYGIGLENDLRNNFKLATILHNKNISKKFTKIFYALGNLDHLILNRNFDLIIDRLTHFNDLMVQRKIDCYIPEATSFEQLISHRNITGRVHQTFPVLLNETILNSEILNSALVHDMFNLQLSDFLIAFKNSFNLFFDRFLLEFLEFKFKKIPIKKNINLVNTPKKNFQFFEKTSTANNSNEIFFQDGMVTCSNEFSKKLITINKFNLTSFGFSKFKIYKYMISYNTYNSMFINDFSKNSITLNLQRIFLANNSISKNFI